MPESKVSARSKQLGLLAAIFAVAFPVVVILLMIESPRFLEVSGRALDPVKNSFDKLFEGWRALWFVFGLPVILFAVTAVHEFGHLILGFIVRFRFVSIQFGVLQISHPFHVALKSLPKTGASGYVRMIPGTSQDLRFRALLYIIGGPLANLVAGTIVLYPGLSFGAKSFAIISILTGAANLVPFRQVSMISDGKRILSILRNDQQSERWLSLLQLIAELRNGTEPKNLSQDFLAKAITLKDDSPDTVAAYALAYTAALQGKSADEASRLLETCLEYAGFAPPAMREALKGDAAVFQARKRKRVDLAEEWLADVPQKTEYPWIRSQGEAAILEAKGDICGAITKLEEVEKIVIATPNQALREMSLRGVRRWKAELLPVQVESASSKSLI